MVSADLEQLATRDPAAAVRRWLSEHGRDVPSFIARAIAHVTAESDALAVQSRAVAEMRRQVAELDAENKRLVEALQQWAEMDTRVRGLCSAVDGGRRWPNNEQYERILVARESLLPEHPRLEEGGAHG